jgi:hypothetical protein
MQTVFNSVSIILGASLALMLLKKIVIATNKAFQELPKE